MDYDGCVNQIQQYLENCPLVILGAGASMPYGLPSMGELATEIGKHADDFDGKEFDTFFEPLYHEFEEALNASDLSRDSQNRIREIVWNHVCRCDKAFFEQLISTRNSFPTCELLKRLYSLLKILQLLSRQIMTEWLSMLGYYWCNSHNRI